MIQDGFTQQGESCHGPQDHDPKGYALLGAETLLSLLIMMVNPCCSPVCSSVSPGGADALRNTSMARPATASTQVAATLPDGLLLTSLATVICIRQGHRTTAVSTFADTVRTLCIAHT